MRRHLLIGRFGPSDKKRIPKATAEVAAELALLVGDRLAHGIGQSDRCD